MLAPSINALFAIADLKVSTEIIIFGKNFIDCLIIFSILIHSSEIEINSEPGLVEQPPISIIEAP